MTLKTVEILCISVQYFQSLAGLNNTVTLIGLSTVGINSFLERSRVGSIVSVTYCSRLYSIRNAL